MAPGFDVGALKEVSTTLRQQSRNDGFTGALLFDGERICLLLEGSEAHVRALLAVNQADSRQAGLRILYEGVSGRRLTDRLAVGYCEPTTLGPLEFETGTALLDAFAGILASADTD
jgi:hypothetical protein